MATAKTAKNQWLTLYDATSKVPQPTNRSACMRSPQMDSDAGLADVIARRRKSIHRLSFSGIAWSSQMSMKDQIHRWMQAACFALTAAAVLMPGLAEAQAVWPARPIKIIVPFPPGGSNDILARVIGDKLTARLGQPVIIDNKGGAAGTIGTDLVAKAPADGYTLLFASGSITTNAAAGKRLPYDIVRDLEPIGRVATGPYVVVVSNDLKVTTLREFIELARATPKRIHYGSPGVGGMNHLGTELFAAAAKVELVHVPYKGIGPAFNDLAGGTIQMALPSLASMMPQLRAGRMRTLAITTAQRSPLAPDIPTVAEAGVPGFEFEVWWALLGPSGMPTTVVRRLNDELNALLAMPDVRETLGREGATPRPSTPEEVRGAIRSDIARWAKLIKDARIPME
jgi:tripartite-type tricarboxylate transporter receptor subunit TctC